MSFKNYKKSIIINYNYDEVKKGVPETNKQMALLNSELKKQMEEAKQSGSSIDKLTISHEGLTNKVKIQSDRVAILKKELEDLTNAEKRNERAITDKTIELNEAETQLLKYQKSAEKTSKELEAHKNIVVRAGTAIGDYAQKAKEAGIDLDKLAGQMQKVGAVLMGIGIAAIKMRGDVDQEMAKVKTIADTTTVSFETLRKGVMKASNDFNIPSKEMAEGLYNVISSNIETTKSIDFLRESAILAKTGFTEMGNATDILATILNSYGLKVEDTRRIVDQLIITQKLGSATVGEMGDSFGKVMGLAANAKIPIEELLAAIATLTTRGLEASEAITGLRGIISAVIKPTSEAREEAKRLGLQFDISALKTKGLAGFLESVEKRTRGSDESMAKLFGRVEGLNSMFVLAGKGAEMYAKNIGIITNATGTAEKALEDIQTPIERFDSALNTIKNSLTETGGELSPILNMVSAFLELLNKVPPSVVTIISVLGMVAFIVGTAGKSILGFSNLATKLGGVFNYTVNPTLMQTVGIIIALIAAVSVLLVIIVALKEGVGALKKLSSSTKDITSNFQNQASNMQQQANRTINGSHRNGLSRVPYDGYVAELHKDEEVLRADDPRNRNNSKGSGDTYIIQVNMDEVDEVYKLVRVFEDFEQTKRAGVVRG